MADTKISALTELTAPASDDELVVVDKSDTTMAASGTNKRIKYQTLGPVSATVASATNITIPAGVWFAVITGVTTIATIAGDAGHPIVLKFNGGVQVTHGTTIKLLGGAFTSTAADTLTIVGDGTTWWEVARSANST